MPLDAASAAFAELAAKAKTKPLQEQTLAEVRAGTAKLRQMFGQGPQMHKVDDHQLGDGDEAIALRLLLPSATPRGLLVYLHGGGWVTGHIDDFEVLARQLAQRSGCAVLLVNYRLAPEFPFPLPLQDVERALAWAAVQGRALVRPGAAPQDLPLLIAGDSAGANLATVVARRALEGGGPALAAQVLLYPVTDADFERASYRDPNAQALLSADTMRWYWNHYQPDAGQRRDPDVAPLHAASLSGMPPTLLITAECDPLRDEGEAYAARLVAAGVPVEFERYAGQFHGFAWFANVLPASARAVAHIGRFIDEVLDERTNRPGQQTDSI